MRKYGKKIKIQNYYNKEQKKWEEYLETVELWKIAVWNIGEINGTGLFN